MILGVVANAVVVLLAPEKTLFVALLCLQGGAALLALVGLIAELFGRKWRLPHLAYHVVASNAVMLLALVQVALGRKFTFWQKATR
jgi:hypothetical protein